MAGFGFQNVNHFFAAAFSDLKIALQYAEKAGAVITSPAVESKVEAISALVPGYGSQLVTIERASFSALGVLLGAVHGVDDAIAAKGVNITLDAAMVAALKSLVIASKSDLASLGYKL